MDLEKKLEYLVDLARGCNGDELDVLTLVAEGINKGRRVYGFMNLAAERRDMALEAFEEVRDALVYVGAKLVVLKRGNHGQ